MMTGLLLCVFAWLVQAAPAAQAPARVQCEFRAFDGADDVTRETRVRVYPVGRREDGTPADNAGRVALAPGLYDVQIIRERGGKVSGIRWVEHLLIVHYPDEGGRHVEVTNFKPQYGALELKMADAAGYQAAAYAPGDRSRPVAASKPGDGYILIVVPAGRYDVRVTAASSAAPDTWLSDVDIPADRTRMRTIPPVKQIPE